jgi:hypothetical protein
MRKAWFPVWALLPFVCVLVLGSTLMATQLEKGEITGRIERTNQEFLRDYGSLDYGAKKEWEAWGRGLKSLGWIVVQGDSGKLEDYLLLVIDTRTEIENEKAEKGRFSDLGPGSLIRAKYKMGWDALHALEVKKLKE